jgi:hypothetical protein
MRYGIAVAEDREQPDRRRTLALAGPNARKTLCRPYLELSRRLIPGDTDGAGESAFRRFRIGRSAENLTMCTMRFCQEPALSALRHSDQLRIYRRECSIVGPIVRHGLGKSHTHQGR